MCLKILVNTTVQYALLKLLSLCFVLFWFCSLFIYFHFFSAEPEKRYHYQTMFNTLITRRALSLCRVYSDIALLVLNGASLNSIYALLVLNRRNAIAWRRSAVHNETYLFFQQSSICRILSLRQLPITSSVSRLIDRGVYRLSLYDPGGDINRVIIMRIPHGR